MPESHWVALTIERIEKLSFDSVARKHMTEGVLHVLYLERCRLLDLFKELKAAGN
jgi:hypothetical protein